MAPVASQVAIGLCLGGDGGVVAPALKLRAGRLGEATPVALPAETVLLLGQRDVAACACVCGVLGEGGKQERQQVV